MAGEAQLIVVRIERSVEQRRIRLGQKIRVGGGVRIMTGRTVGLPDRAVMIGVLFQQRRHVGHFSSARPRDLLIMTAQTRVKERTFQEWGQGRRMARVAAPALLPLGQRAVDHRTFRDKLSDGIVTGHAELAVFVPHLLGEVRTVWIVAFLAVSHDGRVNVACLPVLVNPVFVARCTKVIPLGDKQVRFPGGVRLVAQDACAHRHGSMQVSLLHERVAGMTSQAQVLGRIGPQQLRELTLMGIVAVHATPILDRLVDMVLERQYMTCHTHGFLGVAQLELMCVGARLRMTGIAHPFGHRVVDHRLALHVRMTP